MQNVKELIEQNLNSAAKDLGLDMPVELERPKDTQHGDWSSNIAMKASKFLKKNPFDIANEITEKLAQKGWGEFVEKVEVVKPGFINFYVSGNYYKDVVFGIDDSFGKTIAHSGRKVMLEFTDPNPFKELHIGHLYSNTVGESISRIFEANDANVWRVCYQGDIGLHVAKSIWGIEHKLNEMKIDISELEKHFKTSSEHAKFLGECYAKGATAFEEDESAKEDIKNLNKKIYERSDDFYNQIYDLGKKWSLEYFEMMYKKAGMKEQANGKAFNRYYMESEVAPFGKKYVEDNIENGVFKKSEGAVIFEGEKYGLHNRVFINSMGLPTYEAKELGLAPTKYKDFPYNLSIIITAKEIDEYFKVLLTALAKINPDLAAKTKHIGHGLVKLPEGKMSSRKGNVLTAEWLIEEVENRVSAKAKEDSSKDQIAKIAIAAIKYAFLKNSIGNDIEFNLDESIKFEGNTGPYLQYSYVRCNSILNKDTENLLSDKLEDSQAVLNSEYEIVLMKQLAQYPEVVAEAGKDLSPHVIANYLYELAQRFNQFYNNCQVLNAPDKKDISARLKLVKATSGVIKNGLNLLGIETVDQM